MRCAPEELPLAPARKREIERETERETGLRRRYRKGRRERGRGLAVEFSPCSRVRCPPDERDEEESQRSVRAPGPEIASPPLPTASKLPAIHGFHVQVLAHRRAGASRVYSHARSFVVTTPKLRECRLRKRDRAESCVVGVYIYRGNPVVLKYET